MDLTLNLLLGITRIIGELEQQLDYERLRREGLEAQSDDFRAETAHLNLQVEHLSRKLQESITVSSL